MEYMWILSIYRLSHTFLHTRFYGLAMMLAIYIAIRALGRSRESLALGVISCIFSLHSLLYARVPRIIFWSNLRQTWTYHRLLDHSWKLSIQARRYVCNSSGNVNVPFWTGTCPNQVSCSGGAASTFDFNLLTYTYIYIRCVDGALNVRKWRCSCGDVRSRDLWRINWFAIYAADLSSLF